MRPPSTYGVYLSVNEDDTVNVLSQGRKMKVNLRSSIKSADIKPGQELILNEGLNVVETAAAPGRRGARPLCWLVHDALQRPAGLRGCRRPVWRRRWSVSGRQHVTRLEDPSDDPTCYCRQRQSGVAVGQRCPLRRPCECPTGR